MDCEIRDLLTDQKAGARIELKREAGQQTIYLGEPNMQSYRTFAFALISTLALAFTVNTAHAQPAPGAVSYEQLVSESITRQSNDAKLDQVQEILNVLRIGETPLYASELTVHLRQSYSTLKEGAPINVLPEWRDRLIFKGSDYSKLQEVVTPLLRLCWLDKKVTVLLFKFERPIVAFIPPNAVYVSTRARSLLNDEELEALVAHEFGHPILEALFRRATDARDNRTLRFIELFCDASSAVLLQARDKDPRALISGLRKLDEVQKLEFGEVDGKNYPRMNARERLNNLLVEEFSRTAKR